MIKAATRLNHINEYYFSKKLSEVRALDTPDYPVLNLGIGNPDQAPEPGVIHKLTSAATASDSHGYQTYKGVAEFRNAIARFFQKHYNVSLNPEEMILPLMGSKEGIIHIALAFLNDGDEVLIPDPGYPTYSSASKLAGAKIRTYDIIEEKNWQIDFDQLSKIDFTKVKLMWINSLHMPTGQKMAPEALVKLVALAQKHQFLIVNDNPYSMILNDHPSSILEIEGAMDVALELNSLSKSHNMAGWRLGWVAGKKEYIDLVLKVRSNMDSGMFLPMQLAAAKALDLGKDWFDKLNASYHSRKKLVHKILDELDCTYAENQSGMFVWAKVPELIPDVEKWIDEILYTTKVFIAPGLIFGNNGKRFVRVSLCNSVEKLSIALDRIKTMQNGIVPEELKLKTTAP
ncbi:MAG: aminotransferase class I/II-fold pyridoxal phosphate-dependent enzyme [Flammeovirgaceae bacterium]|nr:aminotransferase class I/II-fold pyridoxal phosphate-dependent enzyme [Flammeovirgaceae bacterium]